MQIVLDLFGGLLSFGWTYLAADFVGGGRRMRRLEEEPPFAQEEDAPPLSVVLAACNEAEKLPRAFRSLLAQEYPGRFEIVAVNDRSDDATGALLQSMAQEETPPGKRVTLLTVDTLPPGWLGKNHALFQGAANAGGRWLLFTDADVVFAPDALSRAVRCAQSGNRAHLSAFFRLDLEGFWEHVFGLCFSFFFVVRFRPWHVKNERRKEYLGVGGFNMVRRDAYDAAGGHRALALEVIDDMELGRRVKEAGFSSEAVGAGDLVRVRWQEGFSGLLNGLTKNAYAASGLSWPKTIASALLLVASVNGPLLGVFLARSRSARFFHALSLAALIGMGMAHARAGKIPLLYALTLPVSNLLLLYVMLRSAFVTERQGGVSWRGTLYPLSLLREKPTPPAPPLLAPTLIVDRTGLTVDRTFEQTRKAKT